VAGCFLVWLGGLCVVRVKVLGALSDPTEP
jgi:hypothetical protein